MITLSPTARRILELLAKRGPMTVYDLTGGYGKWASMYEAALDELEQCGLVIRWFHDSWKITDAGRERLKQETPR